MKDTLSKFTIQGFKSIRLLDNLELKNLNLIVGANGAGKSNLLSLFKMLRALIDGNLHRYVRDSGGAGDLLFNGRKVTKEMYFELHLGRTGYRFALVPTPANGCAIVDEAYLSTAERETWIRWPDREDGQPRLFTERAKNTKWQPVYQAMTTWQIYHFHDTSITAGMRNYEIIQDHKTLRTDAANIAPFLLMLRNNYPRSYRAIITAVQLVIPFFVDFTLDPIHFGAAKKVNLSWQQQGSDYPMQPHHLSDGSIRFICLATALLQPDPPSIIIIDEPELGLHPAAVVILAELTQQAAQRTQVIVATQSSALIDQFALEDIVVANRYQGASTFERLNPADYDEWLESYSAGELWSKNVIAGGPNYE